MPPEISVCYQIQYRIRGTDTPWTFSSIWVTEDMAQRRCDELEQIYSGHEWRPVKVTTEVLSRK